MLLLLLCERARDRRRRYMAGTGKSDYEEWKLFAFPAKRTPQGVAMIVLFLIWALYDILSLPVISNPLPVCSRTTAANFCRNLQFKMIHNNTATATSSSPTRGWLCQLWTAPFILPASTACSRKWLTTASAGRYACAYAR